MSHSSLLSILRMDTNFSARPRLLSLRTRCRVSRQASTDGILTDIRVESLTEFGIGRSEPFSLADLSQVLIVKYFQNWRTIGQTSSDSELEYI